MAIGGILHFGVVYCAITYFVIGHVGAKHMPHQSSSITVDGTMLVLGGYIGLVHTDQNPALRGFIYVLDFQPPQTTNWY